MLNYKIFRDIDLLSLWHNLLLAIVIPGTAKVMNQDNKLY